MAELDIEFEMEDEIEAEEVAEPSAAKGGTPTKRPGGAQDSPASKKTKTEGVTGQKKRSGKFTCNCPGCLLYFQPKDIAPNQRVDFSCKGIIDKIYYAAKTQGRMMWYQDIRTNDQKLHQVISAYKLKCPEPALGERRTKTNAAVIMQYMETVTISTKVMKDVEGEFMYEREFYAFAETWAGGKINEEQALEESKCDLLLKTARLNIAPL